MNLWLPFTNAITLNALTHWSAVRPGTGPIAGRYPDFQQCGMLTSLD